MHKLTKLERLIQLLKKSQAVDSNFLVASIIVDKNGNEWSGVNIEYVIPTNAICAERNAISTGMTNGMNFGDVTEVHILGGNRENPNKDTFTMPCGLCRQAIFEASKGSANIFLYNLNHEVEEYTIKKLLPFAFSGEEIHGRN